MKAERDALVEKKAFALDEFTDLGAELLKKKIEPITMRIKELNRLIEAAENVAGLRSDEPEDVVRSVVKQINGVTGMLGEPSSASLRGALHVLTRSVVDPETDEAEIEVRLPDDVWRRKGALSGLCATSASASKSAHATQQHNSLVLAKFQCQTHKVGHKKCLQCTRTTAKAA